MRCLQKQSMTEGWTEVISMLRFASLASQNFFLVQLLKTMIIMLKENMFTLIPSAAVDSKMPFFRIMLKVAMTLKLVKLERVLLVEYACKM